MTIVGSSDVGLVRTVNQDRYEYAILSEVLSFAVLCDGMGGENGGGVASEMATRFVGEALRRDLRDDLGESALQNLLQSAISGANALVYEAALKDPALAGMGTTLIAAVFLRERLYIACVGDSRVYCASPEKEQQLTKDHTVVQMLVDIGEITAKDAEYHPKRHYITRAVGVGASVSPDISVHVLGGQDIVLLCSDGLYHYLSPGSLYSLLSECMKTQSADSLITLAKAGGGNDNITAVVAAEEKS